MSVRLDQQSLRIYCPTHRINFQVLRAGTILCEGTNHTLAADFPHKEFWEYCCDCRTYWPSDVIKSGKARERCPNCERHAVRRFLCADCKVISIESDDPGRGKEFDIPAGQPISPACPGCLKPAGSTVIQHHCPHINTGFVTARRVCPLCEELVGKSAGTPATSESPRCLACGAGVKEGASFCGQCGAPRTVGGSSRQSVRAGEEIGAQPIRRAAALAGETPARKPAGEPARTKAETIKHGQPHGAGVTRAGGASVARVDSAAPVKEARVGGASKREARTNLWIGSALMAVLIGALAVGWWTQRRSADDSLESGAHPQSGERKAADGPSPPPRMAYVAGGDFMMGNAGGDEYERPPHKVTVQPFFVDLYEVTCEEYLRFVKATGYAPPSGWHDGQYPAKAAQQPVTGVNWDDANAYARWAGKRLPTEEEWEFAARGRDGRFYPWGNEWKVGMANAGSSDGGIAEVGTFKGVSPFGAYDMVGNAWEWTASDLKPYPGGQLLGQDLNGLKVIRGGYWRSSKTKATTTFRRGWPAQGGDDYKNTGFRCVQSVPANPAAS
jgi:formylglycine-generating enzyme required for sulfatase activity